MYWIHAVCKKKVHTYVVNIYLILEPNKTDGSTFTITQVLKAISFEILLFDFGHSSSEN